MKKNVILIDDIIHHRFLQFDPKINTCLNNCQLKVSNTLYYP